MITTLQAHGLQAAVDSLGGELVSLRDAQDTEYIWSGDAAYWSGRNPVLFPIVGGLRDGRVRINGKDCAMNRHGFARKSEFTLCETGNDYVTFSLWENPDTLTQYPFPFLLQVRHQLGKNGFITAFTVKNTGDAPMPFCIGAHTAFRCPLHPGERFEDYQLTFSETETISSLRLTPQGTVSGKLSPFLDNASVWPLDRSVFDQWDTIILEGLRSMSVSLCHKKTGCGVSMDFSQFPMLGLWSPPGKNAPFLCLEPWQGCAALENESGQFMDKPHCVTLAAGEEVSLSYGVTLL